MSVNYLAILVAPFIIDGVDYILDTSKPESPFMVNAVVTLVLAVVAMMLHKRNRVFGSDD